MPYRPTERTEARRAAARERIVRAAHGLIARGGYREAQVAAVAAARRRGDRHRLPPLPVQGRPLRRGLPRAPRSARSTPRATRPTAAGGAAAERLAAAVETFARRALRGRRLAWALLAEPVDPAVEVERLAFRRAYAAGFADVLRDGVAAGELRPRTSTLIAAALVGALGEALVGPLSPVARHDVDADALVADLVAFCLRSVTEETH